MSKYQPSTVALAFVAFIVSIAARPYVVMLLWLWFVCPLGLPPVSYWHAFGLLLLIPKQTASKAKSATEEEMSDLCLRAIAEPPVLLACGAFAHWVLT